MFAGGLTRSLLFFGPLLLGSCAKAEGIVGRHQFFDAIKQAGAGNVSATELYLGNCGMEEIPQIGRFTQLQIMDARGNKLTNFPMEACNLKKLMELYLSDNQLNQLPKEIGGLEALIWLDLSDNHLNELPEEIGDLEALTVLNLSSNLLNEFPKGIEYLEKLVALNLSSNQLKKLPKEIRYLKQLTVLDLSNNQLDELLKEIGGLEALTVLGLSSNLLNELPEEIANCKKLGKLDLSENGIKLLPYQISELRYSLEVLDLKSNPLKEHGEAGVTLGWWRLHRIFGDNVIFSENIVGQLDLYAELDAMPLSWNREELNGIRIDPVPEYNLSREEIVELWDRLEERAIERKFQKRLRAEKYINDLYPKDPKEGILQNDPKGLKVMRDLIKAVLKKVDSGAVNEDELLMVMIILNGGLDKCNDWKLFALQTAYTKLYCKPDLLGSFENFIKVELTMLKNAAINQVFCPSWIDQNVHILNYWKYRLRDVIGTGMHYDTGGRLWNQEEIDPFKGNQVLALRGFYSHFTPERVIKKLKEAINDPENQVRLREMRSFLMDDIKASGEEETAEIRRLFESEDRDAVKSLNPKSVKDEGVEEILVKMGILRRLEGHD